MNAKTESLTGVQRPTVGSKEFTGIFGGNMCSVRHDLHLDNITSKLYLL